MAEEAKKKDSPSKFRTSIGGQALIEGVLMRGPGKQAIVVRSPEGLEEKNLKEMLRFANAAASLITTRKGALRVMPEKEEIEKML